MAGKKVVLIFFSGSLPLNNVKLSCLINACGIVFIIDCHKIFVKQAYRGALKAWKVKLIPLVDNIF